MNLSKLFAVLSLASLFCACADDNNVSGADDISSTSEIEYSSSDKESDSEGMTSSSKKNELSYSKESEKKSSSSQKTATSSSADSTSSPTSSSAESSSAQSSSSEKTASSSSSSLDAPASSNSYLNPDITYGTFIDTRDGKTYRTTKIGEMVWMAENLNYADSVKTPILKDRNWCYGDRPKDCETFGRLYSWFAAIDSVALATDKKNPIDCGYGEICNLPEKVQGICPSGWHLPNRNEWEYLFEAIGGQEPLGGMVLKAKKSWKKPGYDTYGFSALAGGLRESGGQYLYEGTCGYFWSSTPFKIKEAYGVFLGDHVDDVSLSNAGDRNMGFSVRCVQDYSWTLKVSSSSSLVQESSSSSVDPEGWNWARSKEELFNPNIEYGTLMDPRDLQKYRTVTISLPEKNYSEVWMAENLNYDGPQTKGKSWCYNFEPDKCALGGRFYIWTAAIDSLALATDKDNPIVCSSYAKCGLNRMVQGVCPDGWHLPLKEEWDRLVDALGKNDAGRQLKSLKGWDQNYEGTDLNNGIDAYGFSALPLGRMFDDGRFSFLGSEAYFWSSTENSYGEVYFMKLDNAHSNAPVGTHSKKLGRSVRCVKGEVVAPSSSNSGSSSSGVSNGWSWDVPKEKRFNSNIEYGSMIDPRDNREYKTVTIAPPGKDYSRVWMAENLNYADSVRTPALKGRNWCYNDSAKYCEVGGRYYTWAAAIDSIALATDPEDPIVCGDYASCKGKGQNRLNRSVQGICPEGWHLPTIKEWEDLIQATGGSDWAGGKLKARAGWFENGMGTGQHNGSDTYGFTALPVGTRVSSEKFASVGSNVYYWSASEDNYRDAKFMNINNVYSKAYLSADPKYFGCSVRCVKN